MFSQVIEKLKQLSLNKEADFAKCMNYFLDITEDPKFLSEGTQMPDDNEFFTVLLEPVAKFFNAEVNVKSLFLIRMKNYHFIHGTAELSNHRLVMLYYFEDVNFGIAGTGEIGNESHFFRITVKVNGIQESSTCH